MKELDTLLPPIDSLHRKKLGDVPPQDDDGVVERCYHYRAQRRMSEATLELVRLKSTGTEPHQAERLVFDWYGINPIWLANPSEIRLKACDAHGVMWLVAIKGTNLTAQPEEKKRQSLWTALKAKACWLVQEIESMQAATLGKGEAVVERIDISEVKIEQEA